jgi:hypothetical protein
MVFRGVRIEIEEKPLTPGLHRPQLTPPFLPVSVNQSERPCTATDQGIPTVASFVPKPAIG